MRIAAFLFILLIILPLYPQPVRAGTPGAIDVKYSGLDFPVSFTFAPDGRLFFNEKNTGNIRIILSNGTLLPTPFAIITPLFTGGESGLLGIALDPDFPSNHYVYVFFNYRDSESYTHGHIRRYTDNGNIGINQFELFDVTSSAPGTIYHNGGYIKFGPDGKLYAVVGEFHTSSQSQNLTSTDGKILRMNPDGSVPPDNPDPSRLAWAYGIRNSFGMEFDPDNGRLIEMEAGPDRDEINIIVKGGNYGWPDCIGPCDPPNPSYIDPIHTFIVDPPTLPVTPTGVAYGFPNTYYFGEYTSGNLKMLQLTEDGTFLSITQVYNTDGIVAVERGLDGDIYFSTPDTIYVYHLNGVPPPPPSTDFPVSLIYLLALVVVAGATASAILLWRKRGRGVRVPL